MKRISLFIVVFSFCLWAKAQQAEQNEESYSTIGQKRWEMQYQDEDGNNKFMEYEMENISDTLINGLRYVPVSFYEKALEVTYSCIELKMDYDHRDTIFCRQEGEKVYFVPKGETEDFLVLDYGLNIGDSYTNPAGDEFVVVERGTFPKYASQVYTYGKRAPMMLKLQSKDGTKEDVWIEGLGSTVWGIDPRLSAYNAHTCFARTGGRNDHELDAVYNVFLDKYKFASFMPQEPERHETDESWSVSFHADTLCVKGVAGVRDFNGPNYFEMIVTEDNVIAMTDFLSPHSHPYISNKYTDIDVRIPGFEAGTYIFGTESLVCKGVDGINKIEEVEMVNGKCYDLSGRRVSKPKSGVYIKNQQKVVLK